MSAWRRLVMMLLPMLSVIAMRGEDDTLIGSRITPFDASTAQAVLSAKSLADIEGIWMLTEVDGTIAIIGDTDNPRLFRIIAIDLADRSLLPGTVIGTVSLTAKQGYYDARMLTDVNRFGQRSTAQFILNLDSSSGSVSFEPVVNGYKLQPWKLMPYMFRNVIKRVDNRRTDLVGAIRMFPTHSQRLARRSL